MQLKTPTLFILSIECRWPWSTAPPNLMSEGLVSRFC